MEFWLAPQDPTFAPKSAPANADPPNVPAEESVSLQDVEEVPGEADRPVVESKVLDNEKPKNLTPSPAVKAGGGGIRSVLPPALAPPLVISPLFPPSVGRMLAPPPSMSITAIDSGVSTWDILSSFAPDEENNDFRAEGRRVISPLSPPPGKQMLAPPPSMSITAIDSRGLSWDILRSFVPDEENNDFGAEGRRRRSFNSEEDGEEEVASSGGEVAGEELWLGETSEDFNGTSSYSTMNDDDAFSTSTGTMFIISQNGKFKRRIRSWMRGLLLGSGSFGMVYEGMSD